MTRRRPKTAKQPSYTSRLAVVENEVRDLREQLALERIHFEAALETVAKTRLELEVSRERYVDLFDTAPVGYILLDRYGLIHEANATATRMFVSPRERLGGSLLSRFVPGDHHRTLLQHLHRCRRSPGDEDVTTEVKVIGKDGRLLDIVLMSRTESPPSKPPAQLRFRTALVDITARKEAEKSLAAVKEQLQATLTASDIGTWWWDLIENILVTDDNLKRLFYLETGNDVSVERYLERIITDDRDRIKKAIESAIRECSAFDEQYRIVAADEERWLHARGKVDCDEVGTARFFTGVVLDITQRKLAEQALRESEERLRLFIEYAPSALAMFDRNMRYLAVSQRWMDDYDLGSRSILGQSHYDVFPEIPDQWKEVHQRGLAGEVLRRDEDRFKRANGSLQWLRWEVRPWRRSDGQVGGIIIFTEDITARKQVELALRESEERFAKAFQASPNPIGITEVATGRCIEVNDACLELFGFCREEVIGSTTLTLGIWPNEEDRAQLIRRLQADGPVRNLELRFKTKSGALRHILVSSDLTEFNNRLCLLTVGNDITQRKLAEQALHESEERFRTMAQAVPSFLFETDAEGWNIWTSEGWCRFTGQTQEQVAGHGWAEALHPEDRAANVDRWIQCMKDAVPFESQQRLRRSDGTYVWVIARALPVRDSEGKVTRWVGSVTNVDDIVQAQEAVQESQERLRSLNESLERRVKERTAALVEANERWDWVVRATNEAVWDWDLVHDTVYFSPRWKTMHGFEEEDGTESKDEWFTRIHPEDLFSVRTSLEAYLHGEQKTFSEEYRVRRKDGTYFWVLDRGIAIFNEQGRPVRMVGAETDITWRKGVEQALRFREQQFHMLADNVPGLFAYVGPDRRYRFINKEYGRLLGRSDEEIANMSVRDLLDPESYAEVEPQLDKALSGQPVTFEHERKRQDGSGHFLAARYVPDRNDRGEVIGVFKLYTDITALKSTEALLREQEAQLRHLGAMLLQAQEEERRRISRDLHDDVMQRLGVLTMELYGLASSSSSQDMELLSRIKACGASAEQLTTDLQRMAHQLHPSVLEFGGLKVAVRELVHEFGARAGLSAEVVIRDLPRDIPLDHATCLYRVLQEGLHNVQKHAKATTVLVRLLGSSQGLGLCIHDDGCGIENSNGGGRRRGMGLTSMAERVRMLNGTFRIKTKPDNGTELHAWVPLKQDSREM